MSNVSSFFLREKIKKKNIITIYKKHIIKNDIETVRRAEGNLSIRCAIKIIYPPTSVSTYPKRRATDDETALARITKKVKHIATGTRGRTHTFAISEYIEMVPKEYIRYGSVAI